MRSSFVEESNPVLPPSVVSQARRERMHPLHVLLAIPVLCGQPFLETRPNKTYVYRKC